MQEEIIVNIAVLGYGTVGSGVVEVLTTNRTINHNQSAFIKEEI